MTQSQMWNSLEKGFQSPANGMLRSPAEIRGKLNFSSAMTPPALLRRGTFGGHDTPSNINNRLGDYHMSKQNPAVLDSLYSPSSIQLYKPTSPLFNHTYTNGFSMASRNGRTPLHTSLLRQTLDNNSRRNSLPWSGSSLVHLAAQRRHRSYDSVPVSPVIVRLSGPASTVEDTTNIRKDENGKLKVNPCDKNVVISALKKSRKRWAASSSDPLSDILPTAKRSRPNVQPEEGPNYVPRERKRPNIVPPPTSHLTKKSKPLPLPTSNVTSKKPLNRIRVPEIEYESDAESEPGGAAGLELDGTTAEPRESGGDRERSHTPPVVEEEDMKKMREETLKLQRSLTTVFPSSLKGRSSSRRKLPVLCATGSKPHIPTPLSRSNSATHEDLKKDRELAAAKLKHLLSQVEEEVNEKVEVNTTQISASLTLLVSTNQQPSSTAVDALNLTSGSQLTGGGAAKPPTSVPLVTLQSSSSQPVAVSLTAQSESSTVTTSTITAPVMSIGLTGLTATQTGLTTTQTGLTGLTATQTGLTGPTATQTGLTGPTATQTGLTGPTATQTGLTGPTATQTGLTGLTATQTGLTGLTTTQTGLTGLTATQTGLTGLVTTQTGLTGTQTGLTGLTGPTATQTGLTGLTATQTGATGLTATQTGLTGLTTAQTGLTGLTATQTGLQSALQFKGSAASTHQHPTVKSVSFALTTTTNTPVNNVLTLAQNTQKLPQPQVTASGLMMGNKTLAVSGTTAQLPSLGSLLSHPSSSMAAPATGFSLPGGLNLTNSQAPNSNGLGVDQKKQSMFSFSGNSNLGNLFGQTTSSTPSMSAAPALSLSSGQPSLFSSQPTSVAQMATSTGGLFGQSQDAAKTGFTFNLAPTQGSQQNSQMAGQNLLKPTFGQNLTNGSSNSAGLFQNATNQSGGGLNFNFSKVGNSDTKLSFSAGIPQSQQQPLNMFGGGLNSNPQSQNAQSQNAFNFSAGVNTPPVGGVQSQGLFMGNAATSTGFSFNSGQASTGSQGLFGNNPQQQPQQISATTFQFTGLQGPQNSQSTGLMNLANGGQNQSNGGFNFPMPQASMTLGQQPQGGSNMFNFTAGSATPQKPTNNMFNMGSNPLGSGFTTPQPQQPGSFNFANQPLTPSNGFQMAPFGFNPGAAGSPSAGQGGRPMARARRRAKK